MILIASIVVLWFLVSLCAVADGVARMYVYTLFFLDHHREYSSSPEGSQVNKGIPERTGFKLSLFHGTPPVKQKLLVSLFFDCILHDCMETFDTVVHFSY
jgi:hypothetical protein